MYFFFSKFTAFILVNLSSSYAPIIGKVVASQQKKILFMVTAFFLARFQQTTFSATFLAIFSTIVIRPLSVDYLLPCFHSKQNQVGYPTSSIKGVLKFPVVVLEVLSWCIIYHLMVNIYCIFHTDK